MARAILLIGTIAWGVTASAGLVLAAVGADALESALPPLSIDTDALRGAIVAVAFAMAVTAVLHAAILVGLRRERRRARTAGILLAALLAATLVALAAAAFTSAIATPAYAAVLVVAGIAAAVGAAAYATVAAQLVGELRSESAS